MSKEEIANIIEEIESTGRAKVLAKRTFFGTEYSLEILNKDGQSKHITKPMCDLGLGLVAIGVVIGQEGAKV